MKSDNQGTSTCAAGTESFETFTNRGTTYLQYDYRTTNGKLYSTVATSLQKCREKRNTWLTKISAIYFVTQPETIFVEYTKTGTLQIALVGLFVIIALVVILRLLFYFDKRNKN